MLDLPLTLILFANLLFRSCNAFYIPSHSPFLPQMKTPTPSRNRIAEPLSAKKRRRRKTPPKDEPNIQPANDIIEDDPIAPPITGELPEFDIFESDDRSPKTALKSSSTNPLPEMSPTLNLGMNDDPALMEAMRGSSSSENPKDLLKSRDRSLEQTFEFDDVAAPLPKLGALSSSQGTENSSMGKKRAKTEARRAAAIAAAEEEEAANAGFSLDKLGGDGGIDLGKITEYATWAGIFLLIAWEVYINSPLFNRAEPMAPVVFQILL